MKLVLREGAFLGQTHIVTGAAQGIGHAIAQRGLRAGGGDRAGGVSRLPERRHFRAAPGAGVRRHRHGCLRDAGTSLGHEPQAASE